jgi:hypothetical protein
MNTNNALDRIRQAAISCAKSKQAYEQAEAKYNTAIQIADPKLRKEALKALLDELSPNETTVP